MGSEFGNELNSDLLLEVLLTVSAGGDVGVTGTDGVEVIVEGVDGNEVLADEIDVIVDNDLTGVESFGDSSSSCTTESS